MKKIMLNALIILGVLFLGCSAIYHKRQNEDLQDKIDFYEKVITDFGFEEFINYPDLYYTDGYVDQAKIHQCMWVIDTKEE